MKKIVVLISSLGTGSNLHAILDAISRKKLSAEVVAVIADQKDAVGLLWADKYGVPISIVRKKEELLPKLNTLDPDFIVLAGWKQIVTKQVIDKFPNKILNLHPGIIPDTLKGSFANPDGTPALWNKGKFTTLAIQEFLEKKATYAGSSVHFLSQEFDFGKVLGRAFEKVQTGDTIESLYNRLKKKENKLYVEVLQELCNK